MKLKLEKYNTFIPKTDKNYKEFMTLFNECFPSEYIDDDESQDILKEFKVNLCLDKNNIVVGFLVYLPQENEKIEISFLGVKQNEKYLNKGIATKMVDDLIKDYEDNTIVLCCNKDNESAKYLYNKLGFDTFYVTHGQSMNLMIYDSNKRYRDTASVIYELYNENLKTNETLEETLFRMFSNKEYDNIYQHNITQEDIDNTILKNKIFPRALSLLEDMKKGCYKEDIFHFIVENINKKSHFNVDTGIELIDISDSKMLKSLLRVFSAIDNKFKDNKISKKK